MKPKLSEPLALQYAGENLFLFAEKALFWARRKTLIIADPHFGKAAAFRALGIAVPEGTLNQDLQRLGLLLEASESERLVILGDFFHAKAGKSVSTLQSIRGWRNKFSHLEVLLITGNHDRHAGKPPRAWDFTPIAEPWQDGPFMYSHEPQYIHGFHVLCGHIHPCISLRNKIGGGMRVPCFSFTEERVILPAFGNFCGMANIEPQPKEKIFAIGPNEVIPIKR